MTIKDVPILDLRGVPVEQLANVEQVQNVRTIVLDAQNAEAFMRIPRVNVRSHLIVKPDESLFTGQIDLNDPYLSRMQDDTSCVLLGQALIDGFTISLFLRKVRSIRIYGQVLYADAASAGALLSRTERLQGQLLWMPRHSRRWIGATHLDVERLQSLNGKPVVSIGPITIDPQVTVADITSLVPAMTQIGEIKGREDVVCALLSRCKTRLGNYSLSQAQTTPVSHPALRVVQHP